MKTNNPWDLLSNYFNTNKELIPDKVADNILIAWPVILGTIKEYFSKENARALDFGCGTGGFAYKLYELGFKVIGIDTSSEMIRVAKNNYPNIGFYKNDSKIISELKPFNIITSIMTLQFIKNVEKTISHFSGGLETGGLLIFAVHNPKFVEEGIKNGDYTELDLKTNPKLVTFKLGNITEVTMYIRTAKEYNSICKKNNLIGLSENYPIFTKNFITKYPSYAHYKSSEYMILAYRKF